MSQIYSCRRHENNYYVRESHYQESIESAKIVSANTFAHPRTMVVETLNADVTVRTVLSPAALQQTTNIAKPIGFSHLLSWFLSWSGYSRL